MVGALHFTVVPEDEIEIKGALAAMEIEKRRCKIQREEQDLTRC